MKKTQLQKFFHQLRNNTLLRLGQSFGQFHLRLHFWKFIIDDMYNLHIRLNFKSFMGPWWRQRVGSTTPKFRSLT